LKADVPVLATEELENAIRGLSDAQWLRLRKAAGYFARVYELDRDDLIQEAFCRALAGTRNCPVNVDLVKFFVEAMRSIANGEAEKIENVVETVPVRQNGALDAHAVDLKDSTENQEDVMIAADDEELTRQRILRLFPDDQQACDLVDGILAGYEGKELRELTDLDQTSYASKRRYMRRTIDKHQAKGKKS
jgi:DNA-directed RNA polymerase specialized sigma24 family protein